MLKYKLTKLELFFFALTLFLAGAVVMAQVNLFPLAVGAT